MKQMYTLSEMAAELERQEAVKVDYLADTRRMHFVTSEPGSEMDLLSDGGDPVAEGLRVNEVAHDQIAGHLNIPRLFYRRLRGELPGLLDENVNRLLRHEPKQRMVRTLDGTARAFLSDAYRRIDNHDIAQTVLPILGEIPDVRIESCALTDQRMHIKAITPKITGEVKVGEEVCAGVYIGNSEVGRGSLEVYPFIYTLICTNGMIVEQAGEGMMRRIHLGRRVEADNAGRVFRAETLAADDRALMLALGDVVRAAVDEVRFRDLIAQMAEAAAGSRVADPVAAVQVLAKREGLGDGEQRDVLRHLAEGGDLSRWGVLSAVTRAAEDVEGYDRATDLETLGGKILAYSPADWRALATA
jgi:hypothetical protein